MFSKRSGVGLVKRTHGIIFKLILQAPKHVPVVRSAIARAWLGRRSILPRPLLEHDSAEAWKKKSFFFFVWESQTSIMFSKTYGVGFVKRTHGIIFKLILQAPKHVPVVRSAIARAWLGRRSILPRPLLEHDSAEASKKKKNFFFFFLNLHQV